MLHMCNINMQAFLNHTKSNRTNRDQTIYKGKDNTFCMIISFII